jgi:hypothetical protein
MEPLEMESLAAGGGGGPSSLSGSTTAIRSRRSHQSLSSNNNKNLNNTNITTNTSTNKTIIDSSIGPSIIAMKRQISTISPPQIHSSLGGACSNLINSIVGAGIIGIPYALNESGLIAGVVLLVLVSYLTDKSLRLLVEVATFSSKLHGRGVLTFEDLLSVRATTNNLIDFLLHTFGDDEDDAMFMGGLCVCVLFG